MGSVDRGDDQTFKVNFTGKGVAKLRDAVKEKLKEFIDDYTDDTLVVLLPILSVLFMLSLLHITAQSCDTPAAICLGVS